MLHNRTKGHGIPEKMLLATGPIKFNLSHLKIFKLLLCTTLYCSHCKQSLQCPRFICVLASATCLCNMTPFVWAPGIHAPEYQAFSHFCCVHNCFEMKGNLKNNSHLRFPRTLASAKFLEVFSCKALILWIFNIDPLKHIKNIGGCWNYTRCIQSNESERKINRTPIVRLFFDWFGNRT